jgi:hypothetical protein
MLKVIANAKYVIDIEIALEVDTFPMYLTPPFPTGTTLLFVVLKLGCASDISLFQRSYVTNALTKNGTPKIGVRSAAGST